MKLFFQKYSKNTLPLESIILLHGLGGTGKIWRPIAAQLEEQFEVLCPDQRGHGLSKTNENETDFTPENFALDLNETFFNENKKEYWVVGHSMGSRSAASFASLFPEHCKGIVLVDLSLFGRAGGGIGAILELFLDKLPPSFKSRIEARDFLKIHCPDPSIALYLLAVSEVSRETGELTFPFQKDALLKIIHQSLSKQTGTMVRAFSEKTGKPVYLLRGGKSLVYTEEAYQLDIEKMSDLPNVHFITFEGASHGLPFEKRPQFCEFLVKILTQTKE